MKAVLALAAVLVGLSSIFAARESPPLADAVSNAPGQIRPLLSKAEAEQLVDAAIQRLKAATASGDAFKSQAKEVAADAAFLAAVGYVANQSNYLPYEYSQLAFAAQGILKAQKADDRAAAAKSVEYAAGYKSWKMPDIAINVALAGIVPIKDYMKELQEVFDAHQKLTRLPAAEWAKLKPDDVYMQTKKLAVFVKGMDGYAPAKDIDDKKTVKAWGQTNALVVENMFLVSDGAKSGKQSEFRAAFRKTDASCTNCHTIFRE